MLADDHTINKSAELERIPMLNKFSGITEGKISNVNLEDANRKTIWTGKHNSVFL